MAFTHKEIHRRRPVWIALSDLYLDTELQAGDYEHIRDVILASGYTLDEVERILRFEVGPVLGLNLLSVAGVWSGFDPDWLVDSILQRQRSWRRCLPSFLGFRMVRDAWERVRDLMRQETSGAAADSSDL